MNNFKLTLLISGLAVFGSLQSRVLNLNSAGNAIDTSGGDTAVSTTDDFQVSAFDHQRSLMYVGNATAASGSHSIMRVDFSDTSAPKLKALGETKVAGGSSTALSLGANLKVKSLSVLPNGDLAVLVHDTTVASSPSKFYVVKNPWSDVVDETPNNTNARVYVESPTLQDLDPSNSYAMSLHYAGKESDSVYRIFAVIPASGASTLDSNDATIKLCLYNSAAKEITLETNTAILPNFVMNPTNGATTLGLLTGAVGSAGGIISTSVWDEDLQRLYLPLNFTSEALGSPENSSVVYLYKDTNVWYMNSFVPKPTSTYINPLAISFGTGQSYAIPSLKMLNSAMGRKYLVAVINTSYSTNVINNKVFVIPVADQATVAADLGGAADNLSRTVKVAADTTTVWGNRVLDARALVGGGTLPQANVSTLRHLEVLGDSVYAVISPNATTAETADSTGIWCSSPVYDENKEIAAWTAWTKICASGGRNAVDTKNLILNAHFLEDGRICFVASDNDQTDARAIGSMFWGYANNSVFTLSNKTLVEKLKSDFPVSSPCFTTLSLPTSAATGTANSKGVGGVSLAIFGGTNKVAIARTGESVTNGALLSADQASSVNYRLFTSVEGDVLCAEVARVDQTVNGAYPSTQGFVFVGTSKGLYVLSRDNGNGFNISANTNGLSDLSDLDSDHDFRLIPNISGPVHRLFSTQQYLYVATSSNLYRIRLHFRDAGTTYFSDSSTVASVMFKNNMTVAMKESTANLTTAPEPVATVVVQEILNLTGVAAFGDIAGIPGTGALVVSVVKGVNDSTLYVLRGNANLGTDVIATSLDVPYSARKLEVRAMNYQNTTLTNSAGATPSDNVLSNLYVLSGNIVNKNSSLYVYSLKGSEFLPSATFGPDITLSNDVSKIVLLATNELKLLANGIDLTARPVVFSNFRTGCPELNWLTNSWGDIMKINNPETANGKIIALAKTHLGASILVGYPFLFSINE